MRIGTEELYSALQLPDEARVGQRVPKSLVTTSGGFAAADRRRIEESVETIHWLAALKPDTIGVPVFRDDTREYLEIDVIALTLRGGNAERDAERTSLLIHRAIPYPIFLMAAVPTAKSAVCVSLSHKRWAENASGKVVLDGEPAMIAVPGKPASGDDAFLAALRLAEQPRADMRALYQGWMDTVLALQVARVTGRFAQADSDYDVEIRRDALQDIERLTAKIKALTAAARRGRTMARRVQLNNELASARQFLTAAKGVLPQTAAGNAEDPGESATAREVWGVHRTPRGFHFGMHYYNEDGVEVPPPGGPSQPFGPDYLEKYR